MPGVMSFQLGKPILAMILIALTSGAFVLVRPGSPRADMRVWVFAESHARSYRQGTDGKPALTEYFRAKTGNAVAVQVISARALDVRLISLFNSQSQDLPDLVEVEIGSVGKYFRPPLPDVGFLPLNGLLRRDRLLDLADDGPVDLRTPSPRDKLVRSRFAPWSKQGIIFGLPHDLHPVTITYRKDLFDEAGINIAATKTWDDFQNKCLQFQDFWKSRGIRGRYSIELPGASSDYLTVMLLQRHVNVIDDYNRVHVNDPKVTDTIARYAQMVAGPRRIAADSTPGEGLYVRDMARGDLCSLITPDWRCAYLPIWGPDMKGSLAMMPLPRFDPDDAPTSTWGGTMIGIPRGLGEKRTQLAWDLAKWLYISPESLRARQRVSRILPPIKEQWADPAFHRSDEFFSGQKVDELYIELAGQLPPRYVTPFSQAGSVALSIVLSDARGYVERHADEPRETLDAGLRAACQKWLDGMAAELEKRIRFGNLE